MRRVALRIPTPVPLLALFLLGAAPSAPAADPAYGRLVGAIPHSGRRSVPNLALLGAKVTGADRLEATHEGNTYWKALREEAARPREEALYADVRRAIAKAAYEERLAKKGRQTLAAVGWRSLGPANDAGRVRDYKFTPDGSKLYAATSNGGIWLLTRQGGPGSDYGNPKNLTDDLPLLSFGAVGIAPSNPSIVYAATGEQSPTASNKVDGFGTLRSTDGGNTWSFNTVAVTGGVTPFVPGLYSYDLNVNPNDPNDVLLGTERGIFRSRDGGARWTNVLAATQDGNRQGESFARRPDNPAVIWCALEGGLAISTNGGGSWEPILEDIAQQVNYDGKAIRSVIAMSPTNPDRMYWFVAGLQNGKGYNQVGVFRTDDGGRNFQIALGPPKGEDGYPLLAGTQGWGCLSLAVDPTNPNRVVAAGLDTWRSEDAGVTWTQASQWTLPEGHPQYCHADVRVLAYEPHQPNLWVGSDGGLYRSTDGVKTFSGRNAGIVVRMFSSLAQHPTDRYRLYLGTQDNGTQRLSGNSPTAWKRVFFGDGYDCVVNQTNPKIVYATNFNNYTSRADDGGEAETSFKLTNCRADDQNDADCPLPAVTTFRSRLGVIPTNQDILLAMTDSLYYTLHGAVDAQGNIDATDWHRRYTGSFCSDGYHEGQCPADGKSYASCASIAVNPKDGNRVAFGTHAGYLIYTLDGLDNATIMRPGAVANAVVWDPSNPNAFLMGLEEAVEINQGQGAHSIYYVTGLETGNPSYSPADNGLGVTATYLGGPFTYFPPVDSLAVSPTNPKLLFAGTKYGIFRSTDGAASWSLYGDDFPATWVSALLFSPDGALLRAATWGRGLWEISANGGAPPVTAPTAAFHFDPDTPRPGQTVSFTDDSSGAASWSWNFSDGETSTLQNPTHVFKNAGNFLVTQTVSNSAGSKSAVKLVTVSFGTTGTGDAFTYLLPVIVSSTGEGGAVFSTELTLTNRAGKTLNLTFRVKGTFEASSTYSLPPGQQVQADVFQFLKSFTGMTVPAGNVVGSLRIEVRGADDLSQFGALARVTTPPSAVLALQGIKGRFGLAFNATPLGRGAKTDAIVYNLQETSDPGQPGTRSNLACVNAGRGTGAVPLKLEITYRNGETGQVHATKDTLTLTSFQFSQLNRPLKSRGIRFGYATIKRIAGDEEFVCYGVLNDNLNGDGSFDPMVIADAPADTAAAVIPVIVDTAGFRSEMTFANRTDRKISCLIAVIRFDNPVPDWGYYNFDAGEQTTIPDVGAALRQAGFDFPPGSVASVFFQFLDGELRNDQTDTQIPISASEAFVGVRTYATKAGGLFGLAYSYAPIGTAADTEAFIYGLQQTGVKGQSAGTRSNLAVVHALGGQAEPLTLEITYFGPAGQELFRDNVTLQPGQWRQFNAPLEGKGVTNGFARIRRIAGSDQFLAYAVLNDQLNDDGSFDLMIVP